MHYYEDNVIYYLMCYTDYTKIWQEHKMAKTKERSVPVTYDDVKKAIMQLEVDGRDITNINIYREVGRGSMTTINKFLQKYLAQAVEEVEARISPDFLQAFAQEVMRVSDEKGVGLANALSALREHADVLEAVNAEQQKGLEAKADEILGLNIEVVKYKKLATELAQKIKLSENGHITKNEASERMLEVTRKEIETLKITAIKQQESYNELLVKCARFESSNTVLQEERNGLRSDMNVLQEKYDSLQELYRSSLLTAKGQEIKMETMAEQNNTLRTRIAELEEELAKRLREKQ